MKHVKPAILSLFASLLFLAPLSCAPSRDAAQVGDGSANTARSEKSPPTSLAQDLSAPVSNLSTKLGELGFYVFETPQQVPRFSEIPALDTTSTKDEALSADSFAGNITILNFWATWCPPCKQEMPSIEKLHQSLEGYNFRIAAVSVGEKTATVADFIKRSNYTFPIFLDEKGVLGGIMATQGIPTTYILDKNGMIIAGTVGAREYDSPAFISLMKESAGMQNQ